MGKRSVVKKKKKSQSSPSRFLSSVQRQKYDKKTQENIKQILLELKGIKLKRHRRRKLKEIERLQLKLAKRKKELAERIAKRARRRADSNQTVRRSPLHRDIRRESEESTSSEEMNN